MAEALDDGAAKAHAFIKKHEAIVVCDGHGKPPQQLDPVKKADTEAEAWAEKWQSHDKEGIEQALAELSAHRIKALEHKESQGEFPSRNPAEWRKICKSFARATALGGDAISFRQIASLPDEALEEMDANFQEMAEKWYGHNSCG